MAHVSSGRALYILLIRLPFLQIRGRFLHPTLDGVLKNLISVGIRLGCWLRGIRILLPVLAGAAPNPDGLCNRPFLTHCPSSDRFYLLFSFIQVFSRRFRRFIGRMI